MSTFARITAKGHDGVKTTYPIAVVEETDRFLTGWVVDREGVLTSTLWVIDQTTITKRTALKIDLKYGTLEVDFDG